MLAYSKSLATGAPIANMCEVSSLLVITKGAVNKVMLKNKWFPASRGKHISTATYGFESYRLINGAEERNAILRSRL